MIMLAKADRVITGLFVMPGLEGMAGFHGREDMHQAGMFTAFGQNLGDAVFLAERIDLANRFREYLRHVVQEKMSA